MVMASRISLQLTAVALLLVGCAAVVSADTTLTDSQMLQLLNFQWNTKTTTAADQKGDPIFTGFDGARFEFMGMPNSYYNILTEARHQINAYFTPAVMFDHNGTYITAFGFKYDEHKVSIRCLKDGEVQVALNGEVLVMPRGRDSMQMQLSGRDHERLQLTWDLFRPHYGYTVQLSTPMITFQVWSVPPGTLDEGGIEQPAYLDSMTTLQSTPEGNTMHGVLGDSFGRLVANSLSGTEANTTSITSISAEEEANYRTTGLFSDNFAANQFNMNVQGARHSRDLIERLDAVIEYPRIALTKGAKKIKR